MGQLSVSVHPDPVVQKILDYLRQFGNKASFIPFFPLGQLPVVATPNQLACIEWVANFFAIGRFSGSSWQIHGATPIVDTTTPSAVGSGTGWRKPSPTTSSIVLTYAGNYCFCASADVTYSAVEAVGGVGLDDSTVAGTSSPVLIGTAGSTSTERVQAQIINRIATVNANATWDMRVNSNAAVTITFARANMSAQPYFLTGTAAI